MRVVLDVMKLLAECNREVTPINACLVYCSRRLRYMYEVDQQDRVVQFEEFPEFPQSSGPPSLLLVANEDRVVVAYGVTLMRHWSGLLTRGNEPIALISFDSVAYMSNPPNLNP